MDLYSYAEFDSFDKNDKYRLMDISARGSNRDGAALRYVAEQLSKREEEVRILILVSDGQPADSGYSGTAAEEDLRAMTAAANCGVSLLATIHAESVAELLRKPLYNKLLQTGVFRMAVCLRKEDGTRLQEVEELPC